MYDRVQSYCTEFEKNQDGELRPKGKYYYKIKYYFF